MLVPGGHLVVTTPNGTRIGAKVPFHAVPHLRGSLLVVGRKPPW